MDTKQKNRAQQPRRSAAKSRAGSKTSPARQRTGSAAVKKPGRAERPRSSQLRPEAVQRTAQETHNIVQQKAYAPRQSGVQEQVFKTEQKKPEARNPEAVRRAEQRRRSAQRAKQRQAEEAKKKNRPEVSYVQPNPINLTQLLIKILVVIAFVTAFTLGLSVFFKVENVVVYGNKAYNAYTVQEAGGIETGSRLLSLNNTRACGKIMAALPYVDNVRIGIKLPDTVNIYIEEIDIVYAITTADGTYWLMTSGGKVVEQIDAGTANSYTKVEGVQLDSPAAGQQAKALEAVQETAASTDPAGATEEPVPVTVTAAMKLNAALNILQELEKNEIVGEAASIDVSSLSNVELWYGQRFQVKLGDSKNMDIKIQWMKSVVTQRSEYDMGIIDVSFTTWPDQAGFTPFSD